MQKLFVENWKEIVLKTHSFRALVLLILWISGVEAVYRVFQYDTSPSLVWGGVFGLAIYGAVGRVVQQGRHPDGTLQAGNFWRIVGALAAVVVFMLALGGMGKVVENPKPAVGPVPEAEFFEIAVPHVSRWEGLRTEAYLDRIANPPVWTICIGDTHNVQPGEVRTKEQCEAQLRENLRVYRAGLHGYLTDEVLMYLLPATRDTAYTSLAFNVGISGAGHSTAVRRLNAGNVVGGCEAIGWWDKAGGRVIVGLANRRKAEVALCLEEA